MHFLSLSTETTQILVHYQSMDIIIALPELQVKGIGEHERQQHMPKVRTIQSLALVTCGRKEGSDRQALLHGPIRITDLSWVGRGRSTAGHRKLGFIAR